ncbi:exodeoxyribonuclease VII large subunit [Ideonella sp.]|jgi:exodeoxyribonuclease VII large subunit|uniref:exodeoxyribonuclease VII large subunit n=1 Tax=Ideonella sp. TaxID=1929293 RepID=UPI0037BF62BB
MAWSVSALLLAVSDALAARFGSVTVRGELSGFTRAASGHCYFTLKDSSGAGAGLRCAMFRRSASMLDFAPQDGQQVEIRGRLSVYEARGELQMVAEHMRRLGTGSLYEEFLRLKARLESQGLFDTGRKRPLPRFPLRVGLITSASGAALHDVLTTLARRAPHVQVVLYPSLVQGVEAPAALCQALQQANQRNEVEVLLLCRGGGSLEDLWAFNDERLVRAVAASTLPVLCGVGHETDLTLADLAADLRAPTPTGAAELVAPSREAQWQVLQQGATRLQAAVHRRLDRCAQDIDLRALRLQQPGQRLRLQRAGVAALQARLSQGVMHQLRQAALNLQQRRDSVAFAGTRAMEREANGLQMLRSRLDALNPQRVLARGYAWVEGKEGQARTSVAGLKAGDVLTAVWADGRARMTVDAVSSDKG